MRPKPKRRTPQFTLSYNFMFFHFTFFNLVIKGVVMICFYKYFRFLSRNQKKNAGFRVHAIYTAFKGWFLYFCLIPFLDTKKCRTQQESCIYFLIRTFLF